MKASRGDIEQCSIVLLYVAFTGLDGRCLLEGERGGESLIVTSSKIGCREFKSSAKQRVLIAMAFFAVMFFVYLASMVSTLIAVGKK